MKTPQKFLARFEQSAQGLEYGSVCLRLVMNKGKPRYVITREESFIPDETLSSRDDFYIEERGGLNE